MNISEIYIRRIAREVLLEILRTNTIPSAETLSRMIDQKVGDLNLSQPFFSQKPNQFEYNEEASASKFNMLSADILEGIQVLYDAYLEGEKKLITAGDRTLYELDRLGRKAESLISRANRLLLTTEKTAGLLNIIGDDFVDTSKIDLTQSNVEIDLDGQAVHAKYFRTDEREVLGGLDLRGVTSNDITLNILDPTTRRSGNATGRLTDIFTESDRAWSQTFASSSPGQVGIDLRINFRNAIQPPYSEVKTYKIALDPYLTNNSLTVLIQHSMDGITWNDLPVAEPIRTISSPTVFVTGELSFKHLRIVMTRDTHHNLGRNGEYLHTFGIRKLSIYGVNNIYENESTLVSKQFTILDESNSRKKFNKAVLSTACEHIEADTEIEYYIAFLDSNLQQGEYQKIVPLNRENINGPQIAEYSSAATTNTESIIDTTNPSFADNENSYNYLLTGSITGTNIEIWRNVGKRDRLYSVRQDDNKIVEEGWVYKDSSYMTYIYIDERGGQVFDFGPSPIEIDGVRVSGSVRLSEGVHFIKVAEQNWQSLEGLREVSSFDEATRQFRGSQRKYGSNGFTIDLDEAPEETEQFFVIDRLYPYNHKLLIEGLHYSANFNQDIIRQKYKGAARYAAHYMKRIAENDFANNIENLDYNKFAIIRADNGEDGIASRVVLKWNKLNDESPREQFLVVERTSNAFAEGLVFKAVFKTTNPRRSASLDGYEIKIAE